MKLHGIEHRHNMGTHRGGGTAAAAGGVAARRRLAAAAGRGRGRQRRCSRCNALRREQKRCISTLAESKRILHSCRCKGKTNPTIVPWQNLVAHAGVLSAGSMQTQTSNTWTGVRDAAGRPGCWLDGDGCCASAAALGDVGSKASFTRIRSSLEGAESRRSRATARWWWPLGQLLTSTWRLVWHQRECAAVAQD